MVFVVLKPSGDLQAEDLIHFLAPRMPHYMIPRFVEFVDDLPRTPTGKVRKVELRERGATVSTWDRERAGIRLRAQKLTQVSRDRPTAEGP
jgi:crotonobetaine/carnitine-CoA ligase